jgi:hypothetical protein
MKVRIWIGTNTLLVALNIAIGTLQLVLGQWDEIPVKIGA